MGNQTLDDRVQSGFQGFYRQVEKGLTQLDLVLRIIPPMAEVSVQIGTEGPMTKEHIDEYAAGHGIKREKVQKYNFVMGGKWSAVSQLVDQGSPESSTAASILNIEKEELCDFYEVAKWSIIDHPEYSNPAQGIAVFGDREIISGESTIVCIDYTATSKKPFFRKGQETFRERVKYLGADDFGITLNDGEIGYIIAELGKRIESAGNKPISITVPEIQKTENQYDPEMLRERIADYSRKLASLQQNASLRNL